MNLKKKKKMENEVETHGGGSKAMGLSKAVRGASDDAWMSEGLRGMANGEGMNEGITDSSDTGMRVMSKGESAWGWGGGGVTGLSLNEG